MENKNKKCYYKKNYYKKNSKPKTTTSEKKVTYDSLMHAKIITNSSDKKENIDKMLIIKYIAVTVVLFVIIICSLMLFKYA